MEFTLTIMSDDLETMLEDPDHEAKMVGTVIAAGLSAEPMTVSDSQFKLFVSDPEHVDTRLMVYRMKLATVEGRTLYFHGYKHVDDASVIQSWPETSTLYTAVHDGEDDIAPVLGMGILHIKPADFAVQMTTMAIHMLEVVHQPWRAAISRSTSRTIGRPAIATKPRTRRRSTRRIMARGETSASLLLELRDVLEQILGRVGARLRLVAECDVGDRLVTRREA